jgi:hypothetical protein
MRSPRLYRTRNIHLAGLTLLAGGVLLPMIILLVAQSRVRAQSIPTDASGGCPVPATTFNHWFHSGTPAVNGVVDPANSVTFSPTSLCSFYQWSEQMFLWLNSPAPSIYGGGSRIFDSPTFYDVSPLNASNQRTLSKHVSGRFPFIALRAAKPGPHGLPVILDKSHRLFEVEPAKVAPSGKQLILNNAGKEVEIERATIQNGKPVFFDTAGKRIVSPKPVIRPEILKAPMKAQVKAPAKAPIQASKSLIVQRFIINGIPIFIDPFGNVVQTEEGQATGDALVSQQQSLVYYATVVNDVYAFFLTGTKTGGITPAPTQFPTTAANLAQITTFAASHSVTFPDPDALAIEVKMAWVETTGLANPGSYITMEATVPGYNKSNASHWVATGTRNVTLALVSMHVVGSTNGHPEMIWSTFEHFGNTPNAAYAYTSTTGQKTIPQSTTGNWLFCANGAGSPFNVSHATASGNDILGNPSGSAITPSNTLRSNPWGLPGTAAASVSSNTQIVSINHSVLSQMPAGDVRDNYFMIGATWTIGGAPPSGGNQVGTNQLANTALETYVQGVTNCFSCHNGNMLGSGPDSGLSHIYFPLQPLTF